MKSTDELSAISNEALRTKAKNLRAVCQAGNLAFSLLSLGIFIPLYTRTQTNKKEKMQKEQAMNTPAQSSPVGTTTSFTQNLMKDNTKAFKAFLG